VHPTINRDEPNPSPALLKLPSISTNTMSSTESSLKLTTANTNTNPETRHTKQKAASTSPVSTIPNISGGSTQNTAQTIRIENLVGFAQVPLGLAGPLTIHGEDQNNKVYAPLATVEPTLVASCSRGCKAFEASGGIHAIALSEGMSRASVFRFASPLDAVFFYRLVPKLEEELRLTAESTSRFAKLQKVVPHLFGKDVHVRFVYTCGDASGQNMSTIATHKACQILLNTRGAELKIKDFQLEGQLASDKKLSYIHLYEPRGVQVFVWGVLSDDICRSILGSSAARIHDAIMIA
jgi:hydroxymethylglutaryl-CoA reductase